MVCKPSFVQHNPKCRLTHTLGVEYRTTAYGLYRDIIGLTTLHSNRRRCPASTRPEDSREAFGKSESVIWGVNCQGLGFRGLGV